MCLLEIQRLLFEIQYNVSKVLLTVQKQEHMDMNEKKFIPNVNNLILLFLYSLPDVNYTILK